MSVRFRKLHDDATLPQRSSPLAAGYDLFALMDILVDGMVAVPTGVGLCLASNQFGLLCQRSSMPFKRGLFMANTPGVIDADYVEQIYVQLMPVYGEAVQVRRGERIAQVVIMEYAGGTCGWTFEQPLLDRGGGLGSTGV